MIHSSAPATLMLMGEHAVLHGKHALVAAASPRLHVYLQPRLDRIITIRSALGNYTGSLDTLEITDPFRFILSIIKQMNVQQGMDLEIQSDFAATLGLGSSAAVMVATAAAILECAPQDKSLFDICYASLLEVQGRGSGADLMAAIVGGIVLYRREPVFFKPIWPNPSLTELPFHLIYAGYKTPTPEVIQIVEAWRQQDPARYAQLFEDIDRCVAQAAQALETGDLPRFAQAMQANQKLMQALGVSDTHLDQIVHDLEATPGILAAKISGSGLGDCVFAVGHRDNQNNIAGEVLDVRLSTQGVQIHA